MNPRATFEIARILPMESVRLDEPMARHTTLRVGGPARYFYPASDIEILARILPALRETNIPYLLIGHGSNLFNE